MTETTTLNLEEIAHEAANEAASISLGVELLSHLSNREDLSPEQMRAIRLLEGSAGRLTNLIDQLKELADG